jgi:glutathione S-transferase
MIILHGFSFSNYYSLVKHVLLYKGIPFQEVQVYGGDDPEWLGISPLGKVPAITTEQGGHLSESSVCCDYLEENYPDKPLYPKDSYSRNHVRQIMKISELYLELPSRRCIPYMFANTDAPDQVKQEVREMTERGLGALRRLAEFGPYLAGDELSMADIYLRYVLKVVDLAGSTKLDWNIVGEIEGLPEWQALMADSDISRKVDADMEANGPEFMAYLRQRFGTG